MSCRMVIQGGSFKGYGKQGDQLKPKEVVSLLLDDDDEIERKYKAKADNAAEATITRDNEDSSDAGGAVSSSENVDSGSQASSRDREIGYSIPLFYGHSFAVDVLVFVWYLFTLYGLSISKS